MIWPPLIPASPSSRPGQLMWRAVVIDMLALRSTLHAVLIISFTLSAPQSRPLMATRYRAPALFMTTGTVRKGLRYPQKRRLSAVIHIELDPSSIIGIAAATDLPSTSNARSHGNICRQRTRWSIETDQARSE